MIHQLKTTHNYFEDVASGAKTFEVRRNDQNFSVGDFLALNELDGHKANTGNQVKESGRCCLVKVAYILNSPEFCKDGYAILGIEPCAIVTRGDHERIYRDIPRDVPIYGGEQVQP